jgi:hypothetical protein
VTQAALDTLKQQRGFSPRSQHSTTGTPITRQAGSAF